MNFKADLQFGQLYERIFIERENMTNYKISEGNFKPYDIINLDDNIKYEIKSDRMAFKTNNMCIEYICNKKLSGISTTEADYYIYFVITNDDYDIYKIPVEKIKSLINDKSKKIKSVKGGDNYKCQLYLISLNEFSEYKC